MDNLERELETKVLNAQSDEEVIRIFADAGIEVTLEQLNAESEQENSELSENTLDTVSGGSAFWYIVKKLWTRYKVGWHIEGAGGR